MDGCRMDGCPGGSDSKESAYSARDLGSIPVKSLDFVLREATGVTRLDLCF